MEVSVGIIVSSHLERYTHRYKWINLFLPFFTFSILNTYKNFYITHVHTTNTLKHLLLYKTVNVFTLK